MSRQIKGPDTWLSQLSRTSDSIKPGARQLLRPFSLLPFLGTGSAELFLHSPRVSLPLREMLFLRRALEPQRASESRHIYRIGRDGEEP